VHLLLGQPGSGKDSRLPLLIEATGGLALRFGSMFDRYAAALAVPTGLAQTARFFAGFETPQGVLVDDTELLERLAGAPWRTRLRQDESLSALKIAYYGSYKTGLIPDTVVNSIFDRELAGRLTADQPTSIIVNSYPKTIEQYEHLCDFMRDTTLSRCERGIVFVMENVDWETLNQRMADRLVCTRCESVHTADEPARPGGRFVCTCGNRLHRRLDAGISQKRRAAFETRTAPMIDRIVREWGTVAVLSSRGRPDHRRARAEIAEACRRLR
jgi:adenylate kinase family enzyme